MAEQVLLAVPSWTPDKLDGGAFVALPLACSDCTVRSTQLPFADRDPFERGVLMFLLAGVKRTDELARLLGITDVAFIDLMVHELEEAGLLQRSSRNVATITEKARDIYRSAPGSISHQIHARVLYFHDGTRGYVVAGPLDQDSRSETIEDLSDGVGRVSVGTEGKPLYLECIAPEMPLGRPEPIQSDDAQRGLSEFVRKSSTQSSIAQGAPRDNFTVSLQEPRWERLLVRVVPDSGHKRKGAQKRLRLSDLSVFIGRSMQSPHARRRLLVLEGSDAHLREQILRRVVRRAPKSTLAEEGPDSHRSVPPASTEPLDQERTEEPTVVDTSLTAELCRALCHRSALVAAGKHVPLVDDHPTNDGLLRTRYHLVGFRTMDSGGSETLFPQIPGDVIAEIRCDEWNQIDHLWAAFCAWTLIDDAEAIRPVASLIPDLPLVIAQAHWGRPDLHHDELSLLLDHLSSLREEPT